MRTPREVAHEIIASTSGDPCRDWARSKADRHSPNCDGLTAAIEARDAEHEAAARKSDEIACDQGWSAERDRLHDQRDEADKHWREAMAVAEAFERRLDAAAFLVTTLEWSGTSPDGYGPCCPDCGATKVDGARFRHSPDCQTAAFLNGSDNVRGPR